jgi:hypothetical protein
MNHRKIAPSASPHFVCADSKFANAAKICEGRKVNVVDEIALIVLPPPEKGDRGKGDREKKKTRAMRVERLLSQRRKQFAERLRAEAAKAAGSAQDPLLTALAGLRRQKLEAEMISRLLVAYGREFVQPRPYRLVDLADATAMSISGIRTACGDDEIKRVAEVLGRKSAPDRSAEGKL